MTALDLLRRQEQRETIRRWTAGLTPLLIVGLVMFWLGFYSGVRQGSSSEEDQQTVQALQNLADSLRVVHAREDSLRHVDSVQSARLTAARDSLSAHRPAVDSAAAAVDHAARGGISVSGDRPDFAVPQGPATPMAYVVIADTAWNVPLPVARYVSAAIVFVPEAKAQLHRGAVALHEADSLLVVKDARIATLERGDSLWQASDSLHRKREGQLEKDRDHAFRRGLRSGIKGTVVVLATVVTVIKVVAVASK